MMNRNYLGNSFVLAASCCVLLCTSGAAFAQSGTWNVDLAGNWSDTTKWTGGTVADGADFTATFSNVITADRIVTLDTSRTIGNITASDTTHNYTISGANILTLDVTGVTPPTIDVTTNGRTLTISSQISGSDGLRKDGAGQLTLSGANDYTGGTFINGGQVRITSDGNLGNASGDITFGSGYTQLLTTTAGLAINAGRTITLNSGATAAIGQANQNGTYNTTINGNITGSGALQVGRYQLGQGTTFLASTANDFTGSLIIGNFGSFTANGWTVAGFIVDVASMADSASLGSGNIVFGTYRGSAGDTATFRWSTSATSGLTLNNRRIQIADTTAANTIAIVANDNATAANTVVINTNLLVTATTAKSLQLSGSNTGDNTFAGLIADGTAAISLIKSGGGKWILGNNANTYTGPTTIGDGTLSIDSIGNVGGGSSAIGNPGTVANGRILIGSGNSTGTLEYTGSAASSDRTIQINSSVNTNTGGATILNNGTGALTFTAANFNAAYVNANAVTRTLTLGGSNGGEIQGVIQNNSASNTVALTKSGAGRWILTGVNTYSGNTTINDGVLQAIDGAGLPSGSGILQLRGGVFQSSGTFTRNVNATAGGGGVNWATSSGGFAAIGGNLILNLNGGTASLTWNGSSMVSTGQTLIFGSTSANSMVDWQNALNLGSSGSGQRTIQVNDNPLSSTDRARISGAITNTVAGWGILKIGDGILELTNANTYSGNTTVSAGTLLVNNTMGSGTGSGLVSVSAGATLGGDGAISGATTIFGTHAPGNSPGVIEHLSSLTYDGGSSIVEWELISNSLGTRGIDFDGIDVGTSLAFLAPTTLELIFDANGSTVDWTDTFWQSDYLGTSGWLIYDVGGTTSNFSNLSLSVGPYLDSLNNPNIGTFSLFQSGNDIYLNYDAPSIQAIPEPAAIALWSLLGLVLAGFAARRRRR